MEHASDINPKINPLMLHAAAVLECCRDPDAG